MWVRSLPSLEEPVHEQDQVSTTDPDSTYATKGGTPARLGYYDNYLVDNDSCVIVGVQATAARMSQETVAAQDMLTRFAGWQGRAPESVAADTTYGNGEFLQWLADRNINPYMRTRDSIHRKRSPFFGPERFTYELEHDRYICPAGQPMNSAKVIAITPGPTSGHANGVARARSGRNARVRLSDAWSSISTNRRGNAHGS
jgi:Transposase DDE domain